MTLKRFALTGNKIEELSATPTAPPSSEVSSNSTNSAQDQYAQAALISRLPSDRAALRKTLLGGLNNVEWGKAFTHYTSSINGVTAHFEDGSQVEGDILVGADGFNSKVTRQLLGSVNRPLDMGHRMIYGKAPLTPELESEMGESLKKAVCIITERKEPETMYLFQERCHFHRSALNSYVFFLLVDTTGFTDCVDVSKKLLTLDSMEAAEVARKSVAHWPKGVRTIVEHQDPNLTSTWAMTTLPPGGLSAMGDQSTGDFTRGRYSSSATHRRIRRQHSLQKCCFVG